jgi:2'-5' RNA ligase
LLPPRKPHILGLAIHLNQALANLVRVINQAHSSVGIDLEKRPFLAHITLGRFNESTQHEDFILNAVKSIEDKAHQVVLYKSEPTETGSVYTPLETFEMKSLGL